MGPESIGLAGPNYSDNPSKTIATELPIVSLCTEIDHGARPGRRSAASGVAEGPVGGSAAGVRRWSLRSGWMGDGDNVSHATRQERSEPPPPALRGQLGLRVSGWRGGVEAGEERGGGVAAHQPVTDLREPFRIGDRRQQVGQAGGGGGIEARRRQPAQQCPLLVDTLCTAFRNTLFTAFLEPRSSRYASRDRLARSPGTIRRGTDRLPRQGDRWRCNEPG